nr:MAG TPA: hypothetical protein [Microviridae sp.]
MDRRLTRFFYVNISPGNNSSSNPFGIVAPITCKGVL